MCSCFSVCYKSFCHHDVHDFLHLAVGVISYFMFNREVPSVRRALKWYDSANLYFVFERTVKSETAIVFAVSWL